MKESLALGADEQPTIRHDGRDAPRVARCPQRIRVEQNEVGELPGLDRARESSMPK